MTEDIAEAVVLALLESGRAAAERAARGSVLPPQAAAWVAAVAPSDTDSAPSVPDTDPPGPSALRTLLLWNGVRWHLARGDEATAETYSRRAQRCARGADLLTGLVLTGLAEGQWRQGRNTAALALLDKVQCEGTVIAAWASAIRALATRGEDWSGAADQLGDAADTLGSSGILGLAVQAHRWAISTRLGADEPQRALAAYHVAGLDDDALLATIHSALGSARMAFQVAPDGSAARFEAAGMLGVALDDPGPAADLIVELSRRRHLGLAPLTPSRFADPSLGAEAAIAGVEFALGQGSAAEIETALERAESLSTASGQPRLRRRIALLRAIHLVRVRAPSRRELSRLESLAELTLRVGDRWAHALCGLLLTEARVMLHVLGSASLLREVISVARDAGYAPLEAEAMLLLSLLAADEPVPDVSLGWRDGVVAARSVVFSEDPDTAIAALQAVYEAAAKLAPTRRDRVLRLVAGVSSLARLRRLCPGDPMPLVFDPTTGRVDFDGHTWKQRPGSVGWRLLYTLASHGSALPREELYTRVWQLPYRPPSADNSLHVALHRLRSRLPTSLKERLTVLEDGRVSLAPRPAVWLWSDSSISAADQERTLGSLFAGTPDVDATLPPIVGPELVGRRAELRAMEGMFATGARWLSLVGPVGVGTTRSALEYAHAQRQRRTYEDGVWWVHLASESWQEELAHVLGVQLKEQDHSLRIGEALAASPHRLLVLDDANSRSGIDTALLSWLRRVPSLHILTTGGAPAGGVAETVRRLAPLPHKSALALARSLSRGVDPDRVRACGGLPGELVKITEQLDG